MTSKFSNWNMPRAFLGPMIPLLARVLLSDWITASCDFFMLFEVFSILAFWTCTVYSSSFPFFPPLFGGKGHILLSFITVNFIGYLNI